MKTDKERQQELEDSVSLGNLDTHADVHGPKRGQHLLEAENDALTSLAIHQSIDDALAIVAVGFESRHPGAFCAIHLFDPISRVLRCGAAPSLGTAYAEAFDRLNVPMPEEHRANEDSRSPTICESVDHDPKFKYLRDACPDLLIRTGWSLPLVTKSGRILGTMFVLTGGQQRPTEEQSRNLRRTAKSAVRVLKTHEKQRAAMISSDESAKRENLESLGRFAGNLAHEFNNLITAIMTNAEMLRIGRADGSSVEIDSILEASEQARQVGMRMQLLAGKGRFTKECVELSEIFSASLERSKAFNDPAVSITKAFDSRCCPVSVNRELGLIFGAALLDLCARTASGDSSSSHHVTVSREFLDSKSVPNLSFDERLPDGEYAYIAISTPREQFDRHALLHSLEPTSAIRNVDKIHDCSLLLGILKQHHGGMRIIDEGGESITVRACFPITDKPKPSPMANTKKNLEGFRILLVDDEEVVRDSLNKLLTIYGSEVTCCASGEEAVERFGDMKDCFSVALVDQRMPGIGGTETGKRLRSLRPGLPIVFISGYCDFSDDSDDEKPTVDDITGSLDKPLRANELIAELARVTK